MSLLLFPLFFTLLPYVVIIVLRCYDCVVCCCVVACCATLYVVAGVCHIAGMIVNADDVGIYHVDALLSVLSLFMLWVLLLLLML